MPFEPERYELFESPAYQFEVTRREFAGFLGMGLLVTVASAQSRGGASSVQRLHINEEGTINVLSGKVEFGQGARTELAMAAAEELRVPVDHVRVTLADTSVVPNDGITAGSRTTPSTVPAVRAAAAATRELLADAASRAWKVERSRVSVRDGAAIEGDRRFTYSDLAKTPKESLPPGGVVTEPSGWRILGKPHHRTDGRAMVTGSHRFPSDIQRPGMLYGAVLRAPAYNSTFVKADPPSLPGVVVVRDGVFTGVAARTSYEARQALASISATARWDTKQHVSSAALFDHLKATAKPGARPRVQTRGSLEDGLAKAAKRIKGSYQVPYIQHAPMEPRAAVAEWTDGKLTVWTGTQNPFGVRDQLAQAFRIDAANVRVIVPDSGGGFGGKHTGECAIEAARLAREAKRPVSLRWTRAEEFQWAYFRPAGVFEIEAGLDSSGLITAWDFTNINSGAAAIESPYRIANTRTRFLAADSPLREGSYRGIAATANNFARECFMDELARAAGMNPLDFRLANIENPRLRDVLVAAAEKFSWKLRKKERGTHFMGLACGTEKGSYVAACAEVVKRDNQIFVVEICMAFECGAIVNPSNLRSQVEGSIIQGLGGATSEAIEFEGGRLLNGSFQRYKTPRFLDVPKLEIVLLERKDLKPEGAGETPIIAVAPAIANAAFDATGKRFRRIPVKSIPA